MKKSVVFHAIAVVLIIFLLLWETGLIGDQNLDTEKYPNEPVRIVVPYPAGGGSDTFTRIIERAVVEDNLLPVPLVIQNKKGGSGTIGCREVLDSKPDGYTLLMQHNALLGTFVDGVVDFGPDDFEKIALTGSMTMVIIVREDSRFTDLTDLLEAAKADPRKITFGANQGSQAYFTAKQLEAKMPGAEFAMVNADGGADRYARIIGGHLDAGIFALSEFLDFISPDGTPPEQNIRALTVLSEKRHEAIPEVSTSKEQGFGVYMQNVYYWWAPKGTPEPILDKWASVLKKAMANETVLSELNRLRINPEYETGEPMIARMNETLEVMKSSLLASNSVKIPDIPKSVLIITILFLIGVIIQSIFFKVPDEDVLEEASDFPKHPKIAAICFGIVLIYVFLLQTQLIPWTVLSTITIILIGGIMARWQLPRLIVITELALLAALGTSFIFTEVLTGVILP